MTAIVTSLQRVNRRLFRWLASRITLVFVFALGLVPASAATSTSVRGYSGTQIFSTIGGDKDEGEPNHCGEAGGASSWFFYQAPRDGVLTVDTMGSSFDTVLAVYIGPGTSFASLTNVACNNNSSPSNLWSKVAFNVTSNTIYYVAVDGVGGVSGTVKLNYQLTDLPIVITNQPQSLVRAAGFSATFSVIATGPPPLGYQWMFAGSPINGATQASLTLPAVQPSNEGAYSVRVQNMASSVNSTSAMLKVCGQIPGTNSACVSRVMVNGTPNMRVVGNAAVGSVLEYSEDLRQWTPLLTNNTSHGLFALDPALDRPQRYFRLRLSP